VVRWRAPLRIALLIGRFKVGVLPLPAGGQNRATARYLDFQPGGAFPEHSGFARR
jgi:hypothetical protein